MKKLKPHAVDWGQIDRFLASADKKLASARKILAFDEEACLQQAYEAMLKASGVDAVFSPKDYDLNAIMRTLVALAAPE